MRKQKSHAFGKDTYLLGKGKDGNYYWLVQGTWECKWYWGVGHVVSYTNNKNPKLARDTKSFQHWNYAFPTCKEFDEFFEEIVLSDKEKWKLLELMKSIDVARKYSDMLYIGGAHYTENPNKEDIKNDEEYNRINKVVIPRMLENVYKILSE